MTRIMVVFWGENEQKVRLRLAANDAYRSGTVYRERLSMSQYRKLQRAGVSPRTDANVRAIIPPQRDTAGAIPYTATIEYYGV